MDVLIGRGDFKFLRPLHPAYRELGMHDDCLPEIGALGWGLDFKFPAQESQISDLRFGTRNQDSTHTPMPTYERFEDLPVWQAAAELYDLVDELLGAAPPRLSRSFRDQLERATLSVSNNVAEGFERGTTNELLAFIYIARGSAGEVRSMLVLLARRPWLGPDLKSQISDLRSKAESCSRQLRGWADSLQNSDIAGQRHLNDKSRANYQKGIARKQGEADFKALLARHLPPGHPARQIMRPD